MAFVPHLRRSLHVTSKLRFLATELGVSSKKTTNWSPLRLALPQASWAGLTCSQKSLCHSLSPQISHFWQVVPGAGRGTGEGSGTCDRLSLAEQLHSCIHSCEVRSQFLSHNMAGLHHIRVLIQAMQQPCEVAATYRLSVCLSVYKAKAQ